jgi:hypothetical protein
MTVQFGDNEVLDDKHPLFIRSSAISMSESFDELAKANSFSSDIEALCDSK